MRVSKIAAGLLWLKKTEEILSNVDQPELELEILRKSLELEEKTLKNFHLLEELNQN